MSRLFLVDAEIKRVGGHYLEYAVHVAAAAARLGLEPVILTHQDVDDAAVGQIAANAAVQPRNLWPTFRYGIWLDAREFPILRLVKHTAESMRPWMHRLGLRSKTQASQQNSAGPQRDGAWPLSLAGKAAECCYLTVFHLTVARTLAVKSARVYADLSDAFRDTSFAADDIVFMPTLTTTELLGVGRFLASHQTARRASWHFVFRYNALEGREPEFAQQARQVRCLQRAFARFRALTSGARVHFHCDTQELVRQYNQLGIFEFGCLPIPHTLEAQSVNSASRRPLNIVYLGDARTEKGYHRIPALVADLNRDVFPARQARFRVQSNLNAAGGEPAVVAARRELQSHSSEHVELIDNPMSSAAYRRFIRSGDISLILYDDRTYYARSSGVFAESLAAGMPVLVTGGTWAAEQLAPAIAKHLHGLRCESELIACESLDAGRENDFSLPAEPRATFLLGRAFVSKSQPGKYLKIALRTMGQAGESSRQHALVGSLDRPGEYMFMFPLSGGASHATLRFDGAFASELPELDAVVVEYRRCQGESSPPRSAAGIIVADFADAPMLLRELIEHYEHYRSTASQLCQEFLQYHNADRLLSEVRRVAGNECCSAEVNH